MPLRPHLKATVIKNKKKFPVWVIGLVLLLAVAAMFFLSRNWLNPTEESKDRAGDLIIDLGNKIKIRFVWVEPLKLYVGKYEVSNKIYRRFKPEHNSGKYNELDLNKDNQPAVNVSWNDANNFCAWLCSNHGSAGSKRYAFRLPTEKEWEMFATCGQKSEYPWGPDWPPPKNWNYFGRENPEPSQKIDNNDNFRVACPVLQSGENAWRLFGVGGNVWEWCQDNDGESKAKIFKGGSWSDSHPLFLKLGRRSSNEPEYRYINLGFRVVAEAAGSSDAGQKKPDDQAERAKEETKTTE